jgi:indolepyruvate ferredoxin oxidoreductase
MKIDPRFLKEEGVEVYTGNELLIKGLLETEGGSHLWTGYPGSPVAGFFDTAESIAELLKTHGIHATIANNEALSAAMLNGSQMAGLRGVTVMKSVGLHVASDALALGNLAGSHPEGGALVIVGDDPWSDSTQVPADSHYLFKHMHMPVLEPSTNQEIKDWIDYGFKLARGSELYVGYIVTTNQADGGGSVVCKRNHFSKINTQHPIGLNTQQVDFEKMVLLPPRTWCREQALSTRYERLWEISRQLQINKLTLPKGRSSNRAKIGFISAGLAASYLDHALHELLLDEEFPVLKLGLTYPLDPQLVLNFANQCKTIIIVEERRGFIEEQVATILSREKHHAVIYGKKFPQGLEGFPETRGLNPSLVMERLIPLLFPYLGPSQQSQLQSEQALIEETSRYEISLAPRTPTFCAGCPHRDSASVLLEIKKDFRDEDYMRKHHRREPIDLVFHGDTGCYTMLMFEPTKDLMHNYSGMGLGGGTGAGIDPFITNKQVVFMGDSTFFHSGQVAISNSIKNRQDIAYIILDNKTTAMTGHQTTPELEHDLLGNPTPVQHIEKIIQAMIDTPGVEVIRTNPAFREQYRQLLEDTILKSGVKVIVADKECGITFHRRKNREERREIKEKGYLRRKLAINISTDVCEYCLECTKATGCPGLTFYETNLGRKIQTDLSWCVADTACTKIHACPSFEEISIVRNTKPRSRVPEIKTEELPLPPYAKIKDAWSVYLAGVGGMGIASATAVLVRAGHREGYDVLFCDKNGLAIRNGGVYSQIIFRPQHDDHTSQIIPYGKADLILGLDPLEAARGLDPTVNQRVGSRNKTVAILNTAKTPTILSLLGKDDFCVNTLEQIVRRYTRADQYFSADISEYSERIFGTKLYANIIMLGVAYQRGQLPLSLASIEWAIRETMGAAASDNYTAFNVGRKLVIDAAKQHPTPAITYHDVVHEKSRYLKNRYRGKTGERLVQAYRRLLSHADAVLEIDETEKKLLAHRLYDLIRFDSPDYAEDYLNRLTRIHRRDRKEFGYAATRAALWNLHRVMAIKDEVYVAELLTSEEKYTRDRERYNIDPALGDKVIYRHLNRPEFAIGRLKIRFQIRTQPWMLKIMREAKILRRLLPQWHAKEKAFCHWYFQIAETFHAHDLNAETYALWLEILRLPEQATGYREVRYPKMESCRQRAKELMQKIASLSDQPEFKSSKLSLVA